ncbi:UPF0481 protein At3g47200 isoform X1 [Jatropha curcas]|uniref:UPF0481 protein At3g47200 isoform X1 n=2 Tax=Jatropha curcas TaxID=180498 RepID=UPI0018945699|nr:UPF0481 protein At3g47200 isoform X1 [Jatropha curcas]
MLSDHIIDVENLSISIGKDLEALHPLSDECCIYKVPKILYRLNEVAYTPQVVSIGPFHHGKPELQLMEEHKRRYTKEFLQLSTSHVSVKEYVEFIKKREKRLRNSYAETIQLNPQDFVKMILTDAAFLIMVLLKFSCPELQSSNDRIYSRPWMSRDVRYDILLLENQLPFFILEDLYDVSGIPNKLQKPGLSMIKLVHSFFKIKWGYWVLDDVLEKQNFLETKHLLDFLRICQQPLNLQAGNKIKSDVTWYAPSVTELYRAGVKFELASSKNLLDIEFRDGILKLPVLKMTNRSEILLRNLQAFEQCHCKDKYLNDYIALISTLVETAEDVKIMAENGIIQNRLRNNDSLSTLFNYLAKGNFVSRKSFYFSNIVEALNLYCKNPWHKWKATLKQDYFNNPWAGISVLAAFILLMLTVVQTVCSLLQI